MSSLHELLTKDGFKRRNPSKSANLKDRIAPNDSVALPIYLCRDRKSADFSKQQHKKAIAQTGSSVLSSKRVDSKSGRSNFESRVSEDGCSDGPAIDEVAVRAVISILGGYVGRFLKDESFRTRIRHTCSACLSRGSVDSNDTILTNMELCVDSIEQLAESQQTRSKESKKRSLRNSIRLLSIVASLNSPESKTRSTCGIPNSHLSALAQLYIAIIYKLEKNDRISVRHLLQVFCDSPSLARKHLLPDLWEHFFLPHLLHLKVWYSKEVELISDSILDDGKRERWMKLLTKVYNEHMDKGTAQFALYYKEWLKVGAKPPTVPTIALPSRPIYESSKKKSASLSLNPSIDKGLYQSVFGSPFERALVECREKHSGLLFEDGRDDPFSDKGSMVSKEGTFSESCNHKLVKSIHSDMGSNRRSSIQFHENPKAELPAETHKSEYLRIFSCRNEPATGVARQNGISKNETVERDPYFHVSLTKLNRAITTICTSESLIDCENSIRTVARAWLDLHEDRNLEMELSKEPFIEGLLEVLFSSEDDEILELAISILAELVVRNEVNRQMILNSDPHLEIFLRLLRSNSLFLKAAVLLFLLKPKAKQMLSPDWIPLVLRVLEFGDRLQTLFTIQCNPQTAVFYLLDQLMNGFDIDRNLENAKQVVSLGGLRLLIQRFELGDSFEKRTAASFMSSCIQADGICRHYLANNIKRASILELLLGNHSKSGGCALSLLAELVCLHRRTQINKFLTGLKNEGCLNTMHILFAYLQRAPLDQRPLVAAILLHLDLLGDSSQCSIYREEAVEAIISTLECDSHNQTVQEQSTRALLLLGGRFSYTGEASAETWLLKQAGLDYVSSDLLTGKEIVADKITRMDEEEDATEEFIRKVATVLLMSGNKRFFAALSKSIANGIPCLARACLVTVAWMSSSLILMENADLQSLASSTLVPRLLESLNYDRALEERVLATLSLLNFVRNSGIECLSMPFPLDKELVSPLRNLAQVTWTAKELLSITSGTSTFAALRR
ncbi:putative E3 ubiquitin-protein ligase LIN [Cinnamomum micranthum f. kanehirae]|uniref:Putative E3 ubiquitin-protein ligase LIN n=1 Tax=Cinnamomum micranthum f. kanehirae TaxID=337451 RepID=A0A3S3N5F1_9MAGN|nr:putative E3 ubiquitin-protein ligase LIN [Cinnamomum micranthum f. kanehirae]